jgi:hypothetical protein
LIPVDAENINKKLFTIIRGREEEFAETFIEQESERERFLTKEVDGRLIALPEFPEEMLFP